MNLVQNIAHRVVTADLSKFPKSVVEKGKYCILDAVGCGLYGQEYEATRVLLQVVEQWNGRPDSSILGKRLKVPSVFAARVNGTAIHVADFDDSSVHFKGHPTGVILPSTLALCERESMSGRDLLLAYIVGVEVGGALGKVMGPSHYEAGWHGTATIGTIASAAASAKALGLNEEKTGYALTIAASGACGIRENFGSMVKSLHAGQASAAGVWAALLAERGYKGSLTAFDGKVGFSRVYSGQSDITRWGEELSAARTLMGVMLKRYPSCAATHPALDALGELKREIPFSWEDVEEMECLVTPVNLSVLTYPDPRNGLEAKFSMPYCLSTFMVHERLTLQDFEDKALSDPKVRKLMAKVRLMPDETLGELANTRDLLAPTEVRVKLKHGILSKKMLQARGGPSCPLTVDEIREKFRTCARRALPENRIDRTMELILSLESVPKISNLTEILGS